ncbi:metallophosphoesterase family protein [Pseudomonas syringae]|uniref:metallophosphoesterase family protein n=1 Tax=Pseudomonas syringae TaxID=317 RepID=UPI001F118AA3|nr:metallophosphoesterase [Pseudomonas syringae]MCH5510507.1 metallophosphoesterase [Pseudomonas syringae pv. syringae]MCH5639208.1 metallophosphoesterase [Pseudomonas syringae pv. syringae]MCH7428397.1 metallophosphoesterase [Pseudomonas syringae pv. syringae]
MSDKVFGWLHISDQHIGAKETSHLWPQVRDVFLNDIKTHVQKHGAIHLVVFSGDLVQKGDPAEYTQAKAEIRRILDALESVGSKPALFIVPGNHDLSRVEEGSALPLAIAQAGHRVEAYKKTFLSKSENQKQINNAFKNYTKFVNGLRQDGIPLLEPTYIGLMPGEASGTIEVNGLKVGLVGLNTAWAQVQGGEYKGKIEVFAEQFAKLTMNDPGEWAAKHDFSILVTHHPADWLSSESIKDFDNEIFLSKFFAMHLYGHMHEISVFSRDHGDGNIRRSIQAASLFGMERVEGKIQRNHGYIFGSVSISETLLTVWPRKIESISGLGWKISPDTNRIPGDGDSVAYPFTLKNGVSQKKK